MELLKDGVGGGSDRRHSRDGVGGLVGQRRDGEGDDSAEWNGASTCIYSLQPNLIQLQSTALILVSGR